MHIPVLIFAVAVLVIEVVIVAVVRARARRERSMDAVPPLLLPQRTPETEARSFRDAA
jgi:hypothetical protein